MPEWALSREAIHRHFLLPALRKARIAYLYWLVGLTTADIAEDDQVATDEVTVKNIISYMKRQSVKIHRPQTVYGGLENPTN